MCNSRFDRVVSSFKFSSPSRFGGFYESRCKLAPYRLHGGLGAGGGSWVRTCIGGSLLCKSEVRGDRPFPSFFSTI